MKRHLKLVVLAAMALYCVLLLSKRLNRQKMLFRSLPPDFSSAPTANAYLAAKKMSEDVFFFHFRDTEMVSKLSVLLPTIDIVSVEMAAPDVVAFDIDAVPFIDSEGIKKIVLDSLNKYSRGRRRYGLVTPAEVRESQEAHRKRNIDLNEKVRRSNPVEAGKRGPEPTSQP
jgi:hypothetical protein